MPHILFICHGNVQRSQMAEGYYNFYTHTQDATSAGVDGDTPKQFAGPHPETVELMAEDGIDVSGQPCQQVTPEMIDAADVVYLITDKDVQEFVANSDKVIYWDIVDPYNMPIAKVRQIRDQIKAHVQSILPDPS